MVIGSGFVRSGSGFISTPATRAAARAAGTFGVGGYAGAKQTAAQLLAILRSPSFMQLGEARGAKVRQDIMSRVAAAEKPCPKGNEYRVWFPELSCSAGYSLQIKSDGPWCVCDMWKCKVPVPPPTPPTPPSPPPTTPTPTEKCPRGLRYTKLTRWSECDAGYISTQGSGLTVLGQSIYPGWPGNECVCIDTKAGQAIVKALSEPKPSDVPDDEDGELGDLGKYTPLLLLAAVAGVALSLIKR